MKETSMVPNKIPNNLASLHAEEETLRTKAVQLIEGDPNLVLHLRIIESAMDVADTLRQFDSEDENMRVIQIFGMRIFNAFASSLKLTLSGYFQNSVLILRDILETIFLLDLFSHDKTLIERWRLADEKEHRKAFRPFEVRKKLDARDGATTKKREALYKLLSELAGHPSPQCDVMLRPEKGGDARNAPFMTHSSLEAVLSEAGRMAAQAGLHLSKLAPKGHQTLEAAQAAFHLEWQRWITQFYPSVFAPQQGE
jgi:hypothetical protein